MKYLIVILSVMGFVNKANACSCAEWNDVKRLYSESAEVMMIIPSEDSVDVGTSGGFGEANTLTKFSVVRDYKGAKKEVEFFSWRDAGGGANCGVDFKKNDGIYLVFAYLNEETGKSEISSCDTAYVSSEDPVIMKILSELNAY